jgi:hypothetical protein
VNKTFSSSSILLILLAVMGVAVGQIDYDESNWGKEIGRDDYYSRFDLNRYTKGDVETAKAKFLRIKEEKAEDEWVGTYRRDTMLGRAEIAWHPQHGFVYTYIYHTLACLDYGGVKSFGDTVNFLPARRITSNWKRFIEAEQVKVKFGERHLLVPKDRMAEFALLAVGRDVQTGRRLKEIYTEEGFFWENIEDAAKPIAEIPTFPRRYAHLIRKPIKLRVQAFGQRRIKRESGDGWSREEHSFRLRLSGGRKQGVRVGTRFWVDDLEEWMEVTSIATNYSFAELTRPFIDGREYCSRVENYNQIEFQCREAKTGMLARTKTEYF